MDKPETKDDDHEEGSKKEEKKEENAPPGITNEVEALDQPAEPKVKEECVSPEEVKKKDDDQEPPMKDERKPIEDPKKAVAVEESSQSEFSLDEIDLNDSKPSKLDDYKVSRKRGKKKKGTKFSTEIDDIIRDIETTTKAKKRKHKKPIVEEPVTTCDDEEDLKVLKAKAKRKDLNKIPRHSASSLNDSVDNMMNYIKGKLNYEKPTIVRTTDVLSHHVSVHVPSRGTCEDHRMEHGKRAAFRAFFVFNVLLLVIYEAIALPETYLSESPFWWFVCWAVTFYMNAAYILFLSNFWWRSTPLGDRYPPESKISTAQGGSVIVPGNGQNRFEGSSVVCIMPIAGEPVDMIKQNAKALYESDIYGLKHDYLVIADDKRLDQKENDIVVPCLKHSAPAADVSEPYLFQPKPFDTSYLQMTLQLAKEKGLNRRKNLSCMEENGDGYVLWKFYAHKEQKRAIYYMARNKYDNVPSMLKGENLNTAMALPEIREALETPPSGHSFVYIVDARHQVKPEFKAALLQYYWTWNPESKSWLFHDKLASVQAQHWYPESANIAPGHPLQPNNRFFFDGVMKGRTAKGSVPNAGTMNVFQYKSLFGLDEEQPDKPRFSTYSVTEDKASEIEYFGRGYYAIYHPFVVSNGVPANNIAKEFDRLLRWARGNFVVFIKKNPIRRSNNLPWIFRLWAIEGTLYPVNGLVTLLFYFACILYIGVGVNFLTFRSMAILVLFLALMLSGRIAYLLSVPTIDQDDMWANMGGWLNCMPVYIWSVLTYHKGYAKNAVWTSTGSSASSDGAVIQWIVVAMQALNIVSLIMGIGFMLGDNYTDMWTFFARMGLAIMLILMQKDLVKMILVQNKILNPKWKIGPVITFTAFIMAGLIFCVGWQFEEQAPDSNL